MRLLSKWRGFKVPEKFKKQPRDPLQEIEYKLTRSPLPVRVSMPYAGIPNNKGPLEKAPGGSIVLGVLSVVLLVCLAILVIASL